MDISLIYKKVKNGRHPFGLHRESKSVDISLVYTRVKMGRHGFGLPEYHKSRYRFDLQQS